LAKSAAEKAYRAAVKEIRRVKQAGGTTLDLRDERYRALDRIPQDIATLSALKTLRLDQTAVSDLAPLAALTALEELTLNQTAVSDLAPLAALTALRTLRLNQTAVSDLAPLATLTALENLSLNQTAVSDLAPLAALTALQVLWLNQTAVSDLAPLATLTALQWLDLDETAVRDLAPLAALTALQRLWLGQTAVSDLAPLTALTALQVLTFGRTAVSDLAPLAALTALQTLYLRKTAVSDLAPLAALTALETLTLSQTAVSDLAPLATLTALQTLTLEETAVSDLAPLAALTALQELYLDETAVSDLAPLAGLTALQRLDLTQTAVSDIAPLAGLAKLTDLVLDEGQVADLRPIRGLAALGTNREPGLGFRDTPATRADGTLARLAGIEDPEDRARETLAYLNTLPPWPEPYTPSERPDGEPPQPIGQAEPLLTVEALIQAQDLAGWRFSPSHGALSLFIRDQPMDQRQDQLARMAADRCARLLAKLGQRTNSGGMRQDIREEAGEFAALLAETGRSMAERSLELWGSLIALGELLDANDRARREGRDPLDLLPDEARAALSTFLATAANLVRSFPEARALDDDHGGFARRVATRQMMDDILQEAVRAALVSQPSAILINRVAGVADGQGKQAEKASTVSIKGLRNLVLVSTLLSSTFVGIAGGVVEDVGGDISDTFKLGEKASEFLSGAGEKLEEFLGALPPDEAALLRAKLQDYQEARRDRR
jgi:Leucine-rich repeat (LRR) protein